MRMKRGNWAPRLFPRVTLSWCS